MCFHIFFCVSKPIHSFSQWFAFSREEKARISQIVWRCTANIFEVIFTILNCVRISTVILLYSLHLIAAFKYSWIIVKLITVFYCNFYIELDKAINVKRTTRLQWKVDTIKNCKYLQCSSSHGRSQSDGFKCPLPCLLDNLFFLTFFLQISKSQ